MAHAQITVEPYGGSEKENFRQFEQLFRGCIGVAGIAAGQQGNFLQLHLRNDAFRYYQTLPDATRLNVNQSLDALRAHFCNPGLQEVHILSLEPERFDPKKGTPENFLVKLHQSANKAYPFLIYQQLPQSTPLQQMQQQNKHDLTQRQENVQQDYKQQQTIRKKRYEDWVAEIKTNGTTTSKTSQ